MMPARRICGGLRCVASIVMIALGLVLFVYRTDSGHAFAGIVPPTWVDGLRRVSGATSAESWADVEFAVIAGGCLLLAAVFVVAIRVALLRRGRP